MSAVGRLDKRFVTVASAVLLGLSGCSESNPSNTIGGAVSMRLAAPTDPSGVPTGPSEIAVPDPSAGVHLLRGDKVVMSTNVMGGRFEFHNVEPGPYRVFATLLSTPSDTSAVFDAVPGRVEVPGTITLADTGLTVVNNPVGPIAGSTLLLMTLAKARVVNLHVYDVAGSLVRTLASRQFPAGVHAIGWDCTNDLGARLAPGRYAVILLKDSVAAIPRFGLGPVVGPPPITSEPLTWGRAHITIQ